MLLEFGLEPSSPRYGPFLVLGLFDKNCAQLRPFLAIFGAVLRHIVETEGNKGRFIVRRSRRQLQLGNLFPVFGRFKRDQVPLWAKKGCFGAHNAQFWENTCQLGSPAPGHHQ